MRITRRAVARLAVATVATLVVSAGLVASMAPPASASVSRATVIARAQNWVNDGVVYNQGATHDGYRTDCSGYVSYTWGLAKPGIDTTRFPGISTKIAKADLKRGDILLNKAAGNAGHVAIFEKWANTAHSSYVGYELSGSGIHHRTITYPYFSGYGTFVPYRYNSITGT
ncbi:NlpC/P60 family protein [Fodinicola feengrottensis]|uniref:NlpC/P60 family protein n=1 Tax=Fodinicola feengrottensis TaxID=435914 RepID=UPI00244313EC|nr:NlpC/P60 family protein [Fodinicola feengrottensis]